MKMSKLFVRTMREFPNDAEAISHKLLVRAGFIKKLCSGIYTYLPLMQRVLAKISKITREEMDSAGAQELLMPFVQPAEIWEKSGRWGVYGKELLRIKDRHDNPMCLAPTHEEVVTLVASGVMSSYKQLPFNLYQIQTKFRDEIRPRFGLMRGREFIMKDAYSFHNSQECLDKEYQAMADAYSRIFKRCGLETKMVQSDSGAIGGKVSHEFMVLTETDTGENDVFYCEKCDYSANANWATSVLCDIETTGNFGECKKVDTPNVKTIDNLAKFFNVDKNCILKSVLYICDSKPVLAMVRGDKEVEETKLLNALGCVEIRKATDDEAKEFIGCEAGYLSFVGLENKNVRVVFDNSAKGMKNFIIGANVPQKHIVGYNFEMMCKAPEFFDIALVREGEKCTGCGSPLKVTRGIEVGNIFQLGTKYSEPMEATYTADDGTEKPYIMGCYGIGISRTAAAAVERYHDDFGIVWPLEIAPYHAVVIPANTSDQKQMELALEIYEKLLAQGVEAVLDERNDRAGVKFKDADLIGFPYRIVVGKTIAEGLVEFKERKSAEVIKCTPDEAVKRCLEAVGVA
ncbi:prolyl-tRNA synthetase [Candidatus Gastranaerophilus sp. (ex Termes propinquus)]|nr:prolyl-tRNA synthetase [Candidatus Gastranaerophilus sp. (ex Termes propinquus)]